MVKTARRTTKSRPGGRLGMGAAYHWQATVSQVDMAMAAPSPLAIRLPTSTQMLTIDLKRTAMIVIDMQNDFCAKGGWVEQIGGNWRAGRRPIEPLQALLPALRAEGVPIVWLNWGNRPDRLNNPPPTLHTFKKSGSGFGIGDPLPGIGAPVLTKDSWAAAVIDELGQKSDDIKVDKYRISGFWDTPLDSILRNLGTKTILFAGVNMDQCVLHSLADASFLGYGCVLVADCCATSSPDYCAAATVWNVERCFGFVARSKAVLAALKRKRRSL